MLSKDDASAKYFVKTKAGIDIWITQEEFDEVMEYYNPEIIPTHFVELDGNIVEAINGIEFIASKEEYENSTKI